MTWLYSLFLAGLMLNGGTEANNTGGKNPSVLTAQHAEKSAFVKSANLSETEKFEQNYPFDANGTVSVSNINGSIIVEAWDNPQVKLEVVKTADSKESLENVEVKIDARQNVFRVETDYENGRGGWKNGRSLEVAFHLTVPRTAMLNEIETVNGSVTVSNFTNYTKVSAVNGEVSAANLRGNADLSTVNGTVTADFQSLEAVKNIALETVNGKVRLTVPSDANATLKADSLNGEISNDFGLPVRKGQYVGKDLYGKIGSGETQIKMSSVNGSLSVKRRSDGKNASSAVSLLTKNQPDDNDADNDNDADDNAKMNADIRKSISDSQKEAAKAMKEAQKEIRKNKPEISPADRDAMKQAGDYLNSEEFKNQMKEAAEIARQTAERNANFNWSSANAAIEKKSETFTVKGTPKVTIDAPDCAVTVRGWDKPEVGYTIKRFSRTPSAPLALTADHTDSTVKITLGGNSSGGYSETGDLRLEVFVPKNSDLKITTGEEIRLENVSGDLDLHGDDGTINVRDGGGKLRLVSADALVRVVGFKGELDSTIEDGKLYLEGDFSRINAATEDGEIVLTLPENADANLESNIKDVRADGITLVSTANGEDSNVWKIGKGGAKFRINADSDGKITIRGKNKPE